MNQSESDARSLPEWITFILATLILGVIVSLVIYEWRTQEDIPPNLTLMQNPLVRETQGQYYVPFSVTNQGGSTVESVQVIAELRLNGETIESGEQQIDFLASQETQEGAFVFSRNPQEGELIMRVGSYKLP